MATAPQSLADKKKSTPAQVLHQAQAMGFVLTAVNGKLHVTGDRASVNAMAPLLRQHRDELLALLAEATNDSAHGVATDAYQSNSTLAPATDHSNDEVEREMVEERAAIMQYDGGLPQAGAERLAYAHTRYLVHHWTCKACCAAGQLRGARCTLGAALWIRYETTATAVGR